MSLRENPSPKHSPRFLGMPFVSGITLFYLLIGEFWIYFADLVIKQLAKTGEHWCILSTSRGLLLVYSTGALLFLTLNHFLSRSRLTQQHALESKEHYEIATSAANIGVWDRDIVNNRLVWDDRMIQLYGIRSKEFGGAYEAWKQCIHPDDRNRAEQDVKQAERGEKDFDTEFRIVRPDGEVRHIRAFGRVIRDKAGKPVRMTGINYDITAGKQLEETLRTRNEELERFNRAAIDRELRMIELKTEINNLHRQLGQAVPYVVADVTQDTSSPGSGFKAFLKKLFGNDKPHAA